MNSFPDLEPVCCSMSSSNCCFLTCIQISVCAYMWMFLAAKICKEPWMLFTNDSEIGGYLYLFICVCAFNNILSERELIYSQKQSVKAFLVKEHKAYRCSHKYPCIRTYMYSYTYFYITWVTLDGCAVLCMNTLAFTWYHMSCGQDLPLLCNERFTNDLASILIQWILKQLEVPHLLDTQYFHALGFVFFSVLLKYMSVISSGLKCFDTASSLNLII